MATAESKSKSTPFLYNLFGPPPASGEEVVERYSRPVRILHWVNAVAWIVLFITGLFFFVNQFGAAAQGGISGVFHRIAAVVMVGWAVLYFLGSPKIAIQGMLESLKWGKDDIEWLKAAVPYYFFGQDEKMPPQDHMNTGQKMWWLLTLAGGALMIVTGAIMWFSSADPVVVILHDVGFIALFAFAMLHVFLSLHPKMRGIFWSMWSGTVSAKYAESHHKKWYDKVKKGE
jgi:formate dehydrogenase subunit gamma